jgi:Fur family ferric uptake transcriptional regulator
MSLRRTTTQSRRAVERTINGFRSYLRDGKCSFTAPRREILEEILGSPPHFDAEGLYERLRKRRPAPGRATVYRTLAHLERSGAIRRVGFDEAHAHYELVAAAAHHEHLACERCGKVTEFRDSQLERRIEAVARRGTFRITRHEVVIVGVCSRCGASTRAAKGGGPGVRRIAET